MRALGSTGLQVFPLCLGGNVLGWTADETQSFAVLDAYAAAGGNFVDTADVYSAWAPGHSGGESERMLGRWMAGRGNRDRMIVATKVGMLATRKGLGAANLRRAVEDSLERLQTDYIDLYYAHIDDAETPLDETLSGFDALVRAGKVRHVGASNYGAARLHQALAMARENDLARYEVLQPEYNLVRRGYEDELRDLCAKEGVACVPYWGLASGFLTGKYRPGKAVDSARGGAGARYMDARGLAVLGVLDEIAAARGVPVAAVALAWLAAQPTVVAPIASARTPAQLAELLPMVTLRLDAGEMKRLRDATN